MALRKTVPAWEQHRALATWLWERGPMTAKYPGEMGDKVAHVLDQVLPKDRKWSRNSGVRIINEMAEMPQLQRIGTARVIEKLTWTGSDPKTMTWKPESQEGPRGYMGNAMARIEELEKRVAVLEDICDAYTGGIRQ